MDGGRQQPIRAEAIAFHGPAMIYVTMDVYPKAISDASFQMGQ